MKRLIFFLCIVVTFAVIRCEKQPIDCTPMVERLRGFTFCMFTNQSSENNDITKVTVNPSLFQGRELLSEQVSAIAISLSDFEHIPSSVFTNFGTVSRLKIMHSTIKEIRSEEFSAASELRTIEIEYTKVGRVNSRAFEHAKNLEEVTFGNCEIGEFSNDAFEGLEKLREIRLNENSYKNGKPDLSKLPANVTIIF